MDLENINSGELKEFCKSFNTMVGENEAFSSIGKIKIVGVKVADMVKAFVGAMDQIVSLCEADESLEELVPVELADFYNGFIEEPSGGGEEEPEPEEEVEEEPEPEEEKPKKKATPKEKPTPKKKAEPKPKAEKKAKEPEEKSRYGHKLGSQAAALDDALFEEGGTYESLSKKTGRSVPGVKSHIQHLKNMGILIVEKDGFFKIKG